MTKKELLEMIERFDDDANIITFNRTSNRWFKTGSKENYPMNTVAELKERCNNYAKKQLSKFNDNDITFFF
jgi:hypothetical protein